MNASSSNPLMARSNVSWQPPLTSLVVASKLDDHLSKLIASSPFDEEPFEESFFTALELLREPMPPANDVVPGFLPEGYAILGGREKSGKSLCALGSIAIPIVLGLPVMGLFSPIRGRVLYYALEDSKRRIWNRLQRFLHGFGTDEGLNNLIISTALKNFDQEGAAQLERDMDRHSPSLVILDTIAIVSRQKKIASTDYQSEYLAGRELQQVALSKGTTILGIHHTTKKEYGDVFDELRGTGVTSSADTLIVLKRAKEEGTFDLHINGRDIERQTLNFVRDTGTLLYRPGELRPIESTKQTEISIDAVFGEQTRMKRKPIEDKLLELYGIKSRKEVECFLKRLAKVLHGVYGRP